MISSANKERLIAALRAELPGLCAVYLFGSTAQAQATMASDVDIAVQSSLPIAPPVLFNLSGELATFLKREVDLVDLARASTVLRAQIIATGERLYCTDETACETYADDVFSSYARLNEERQGILEDIKQRGSVYG